MIKQIYCVEGTTCAVSPLEPRKVVKKMIGGGRQFIAPVVLLSVWSLVFYVGRREIFDEMTGYLFSSGSFILLYIFLAVIVSISASLIYQIFYFRFYFYNITDQNIIIRKGVVARNEISIPYDKIQNVFVDQDFFDRLFGLYDVHIATADVQSGPMAHIDGVSRENSEKLREQILGKIHK